MSILVSKVSGSLLEYGYSSPGIFRVLLYSTLRQPSSSSSDSLISRLHAGFNPDGSIIPVLDKWVVEGHSIRHGELRGIVRDFRKRHRFRCALEIVEWMSGIDQFETKPGDVAIRLELISRVHGVEKAETYFHSLDDRFKVLSVYGSLLYCYAATECVEKAEGIMTKIRELNFWSNVGFNSVSLNNINFNTMLKLYSRMGEREKIDSLIQEMEDKGLSYDRYSYNILLNAYATSSDIEKMEKLLKKMLVDPLVSVSYHTYVAVARGYVKARDREKALASLKKARHLISGLKEKKPGYLVLLNVYASMQEKNEVHGLWSMLKRMGKLRNLDYSVMINCLVQLDDLDEAKQALSEWEEQSVYFDIRIPNQVVHALCKKGQAREAEAIVKRLVESGKELCAATWSVMAHAYFLNSLMDKAVEMTKKAFAASFPGWKPDFQVVAACVEHLKMEGNGEGAEEILQFLENNGHLWSDYEEMLQKYMCNGKLRPERVELETS